MEYWKDFYEKSKVQSLARSQAKQSLYPKLGRNPAPSGQLSFPYFLRCTEFGLRSTTAGRCVPYSLFPVPYSLFPIPYSLFPIPYSGNILSYKPSSFVIHFDKASVNTEVIITVISTKYKGATKSLL
jgi:hypothetical protein